MMLTATAKTAKTTTEATHTLKLKVMRKMFFM
jgi:hypothetical protein